MRRREFITLLGGATAWPIAARAQQAMPVVGYVRGVGRIASAPLDAAFRQGLASMGFEERRNVTIDYRYVEGNRPTLEDRVVGRIPNWWGLVSGYVSPFTTGHSREGSYGSTSRRALSMARFTPESCRDRRPNATAEKGRGCVLGQQETFPRPSHAR
jgi:hypothetical protein